MQNDKSPTSLPFVMEPRKRESGIVLYLFPNIDRLCGAILLKPATPAASVSNKTNEVKCNGVQRFKFPIDDSLITEAFLELEQGNWSHFSPLRSTLQHNECSAAQREIALTAETGCFTSPTIAAMIGSDWHGLSRKEGGPNVGSNAI